MILFLLVMTIQVISTDGQNNRSFRRFFKRDGLSSDVVCAITQDRDGFIWLGTYGGLIRYDGDRFTVFQHEPDNEQSLRDNVVFTICEDRKGRLWLGSRSGNINRFDKYSGTFDHWNVNQTGDPAPNRILTIIKDGDDVIWAGSMRGLKRFNEAQNCFDHFPLSQTVGSEKEVDSISYLYESARKPHLLWIATVNNGIKCLDRKTGEISHFYRHPEKKETLSSNIVFSIVEIKEDVYLICTDQGLNRLDLLTGRIETVPYNPTDTTQHLASLTYRLTPDRTGNLWVGTLGSGMWQIRPTGQILDHFQHDPAFNSSLSNNSVQTIFIDRSNLIWVGTVWGLNRYNPEEPVIQVSQNLPHHANSLSNNWIYDIVQDAGGDLWLATENGVNSINRGNGQITRFLYTSELKDDSTSSVCHCVFPDRDGSIWAGTITGLVHFSKTEGKSIRYLHQDDNPQSLSQSRINSIFRDSKNNLWVGTQVGLNRMSDERGVFERFLDQPDVIGDWFSNSFSSIVEDHSGAIWFGTQGGGLYRYQKGNFEHHVHNQENPTSLPNNIIWDLLCDRNGRVWITTSKGMALWLGGDRFERFQIREEITPIIGITEEKEGNLWLTGEDFLVRYNPLLRRVDVCLDVSQFKIYEFSPSAISYIGDGQLYLGGRDGMAYINTEQSFPISPEPQVVITDLRLAGRNRLRGRIPDPNEPLVLTEDDFPLSIRFNALDFSEMNRYRYAYRLSPRSKNDWIDIGTTHELTLLELGVGAHQLEVKSKREHDAWTDSKILLKIDIAPPFWKTWWFQGLIIMLFFTLVFGWHRTRIKRIVRNLHTESALRGYWLKNGITQREMELIDLIIKGRSNQQIADELYLSLSTVKNHVYHIFKKLNINNRVQLISMVQAVDQQAQSGEKQTGIQPPAEKGVHSK